MKLTECFLRIVAVKKHQKDSILKAWFMENVVNSKKYLNSKYTFEQLNLSDWARQNNKKPNDVAIKLDTNSEIINSVDYGSFQARKRVISGEIISKERMILPLKTHSNSSQNNDLPKYKTIGKMKSNFPNPFDSKSDLIIKDPQFDIEIHQNKLTGNTFRKIQVIKVLIL